MSEWPVRDSARGKVLIFQIKKKNKNLRIINTKIHTPKIRRRLRDRSIECRRGRGSETSTYITRRSIDASWSTREIKSKVHGPKRREYGTPAIQRAIDPLLENRSRRRSVDFGADGRRMAGRYSRHTFELQCKRTSVEPYTYSMLLYLK